MERVRGRAGAAGAIAVTGATGRVGSRCVNRLAALSDRPVVALARAPERIDAVDGVERRFADYDDPGSLHACLAGVDDLVFVSADGEADLVLRRHLAVADAVREAKVSRVVYLSSLDVDPASPFCYARTNAVTEDALASAAGQLSVVRAGLFLEFVRGLMGSAPEVRVPTDAAFAVVPRDRVADAMVDVVVAATPPAVHAVPGDVATFGSLAGSAGQRLVTVSSAEYVDRLVADGECTWWVHAYVTLMASIDEGRWSGGS